MSSFTKWGRQWYTPCKCCSEDELKQHIYKLSFYICNIFNTHTTLTHTYHRKHIKHYLHASCVSVMALTYLDYTYTDTEACISIYALTWAYIFEPNFQVSIRRRDLWRYQDVKVRTTWKWLLVLSRGNPRGCALPSAAMWWPSKDSHPGMLSLLSHWS